MIPTVEALALQFSQELHNFLTVEQIREVANRNRRETISDVCHSHDFCDANMILLAVFSRHGMDPTSDERTELQDQLWDQAWNLAKSRHFTLGD